MQVWLHLQITTTKEAKMKTVNTYLNDSAYENGKVVGRVNKLRHSDPQGSWAPAFVQRAEWMECTMTWADDELAPIGTVETDGGESDQSLLNDMYYVFGNNPEGSKPEHAKDRRSLSIGDIISIEDKDGIRVYAVATIGFDDITNDGGFEAVEAASYTVRAINSQIGLENS
jgi:hypothetical protein